MRVSKPSFSPLLILYLGLRPVLQPLMRHVLKRRVRKGKDDPKRSPEKLGIASVMRPEGRVIWVHAVGLGEILALRPLLAEMRQQSPDARFVLTSTARSSAQVIGDNLPEGAIHQFLPLDGPTFMRRFLDHWQPDLSIWSEQDLWPGAIMDTARRGIPLAYINARISPESFKKRKLFRGLYQRLLPEFAYVAAQSEESAAFLRRLGAPTADALPSLKPAAAPLSVDEGDLAGVQAATKGRKIWVAASTHAGDEGPLLAAHDLLTEQDPNSLLILAPRVPDRAPEIEAAIKAAGLSYLRRSSGGTPTADCSVYLADTFGELGLWYRLADVAFVGNSFSGLGGHNPWEAVCLGRQVLHGPTVANFAQDYATLDQAGVSVEIPDTPAAPSQIADFVEATSGPQSNEKAAALISQARAALPPLAKRLLALSDAG